MMTATVHAIKPDTSQEVIDLSAREAARLYAKHLESTRGACHNFASDPVMALEGFTGQTHSASYFVAAYAGWARKNDIWVSKDEWPTFHARLPQMLKEELPKVFGMSTKPTKDRFFYDSRGVHLANNFIPYEPEYVGPLDPIFFELFDRVFMNEADEKFVLMFMADTIQNPCIRPQTAVVITGDRGTGKSTLYELLKLAHGGNHCEKTTHQKLCSQFSEVLANNIVVALDDCDNAPKSAYGNLKEAITNKSMSVEIKGEQTRVHRDVYARIMIFSNLPTAGLIIEEGDRRLYVTQPNDHKISVEDSKEFFGRLVKVLEHPDTPAQLYHFFKNVPLEGFKRGQHISTAAHKAMIENGTSALFQAVQEYVEDKPIFVEAMLVDYLTGKSVKVWDNEKLKSALISCGYERTRREVTGSEIRKQTVWQPRSTHKARALTSIEIQNIIKSQHKSF